MQVVELTVIVESVGLEHRPLRDRRIEQQCRCVGIELQQFDWYPVESASQIEAAVEVPVDIVFPARFDQIDQIVGDAEFMKKVVVDDMISRFDEHVVEFVGCIGISVRLHLFDDDEFVFEVGRVVVEIGMPGEADRLEKLCREGFDGKQFHRSASKTS